MKDEIEVTRVEVKQNDVFVGGMTTFVVVSINGCYASCCSTKTGRKVRIQVERLHVEYDRACERKARRALKRVVAMQAKAKKS
jgi:hypothetical protein